MLRLPALVTTSRWSPLQSHNTSVVGALTFCKRRRLRGIADFLVGHSGGVVLRINALRTDYILCIRTTPYYSPSFVRMVQMPLLGSH